MFSDVPEQPGGRAVPLHRGQVGGHQHLLWTSRRRRLTSRSCNAIARTFYGLYTRSILLMKCYQQGCLWTLHTGNTPQETLSPGLSMDYTRSILLKKRYHQDCLWTLHTVNTPRETLPPGLFKDFTHGQCFSSITTTRRTPYGLYTQTMLLAHKSTLA